MKSVVMLFLDRPLPLTEAAETDPLALALVRDTLRTLDDLDADTFVFLSPDGDKERTSALLGPGKRKIVSPHGPTPTLQECNAFRLAFLRGYDRALLLANACPDLPGHVLQSALDSLNYKCVCLGPQPAPADGGADSLYALGFDAEGFTTDPFTHIDRNRAGYCTRMDTLLSFLARKVRILPEYAPVTRLEETEALAARCADTRFALLPSVRLAAERRAGNRPA